MDSVSFLISLTFLDKKVTEYSFIKTNIKTRLVKKSTYKKEVVWYNINRINTIFEGA